MRSLHHVATELKEISEMYKDSLEVISLSIENRKGWEEASKSHAITWNNWNDLKRTTDCMPVMVSEEFPILY